MILISIREEILAEIEPSSQGNREMSLRKLRLYLDTSPIIMLELDQDPVRRRITEEFFRDMSKQSDEYELFVSCVTLDELNETGSDDKRQFAASFLESLEHTELPESDEAENLAWIYTIDGVLSQAHLDDLRHVAYAVVFRCDYVVTWNMRHLANPKTVDRVNRVNAIEKYSHIMLETPRFFAGESDDEK